MTAEWEAQSSIVMQEMNAQPAVELQEDEQHSRPQRNGSLGHAPYVTVTTIWKHLHKNFICAIKHVDRRARLISSAVACQIGRAMAFGYISHELTTNLAAIVTDACTGASTSVQQYLNAVWPACHHSRDLWHKTRKWTIGLGNYCSKRPVPRAPFLYPSIQQSWSDGELLAGKLKRHFVFCAGSCNGDRVRFIQLFSDAAGHYGQKFNWPQVEIQAFKKWLVSLVGDDAEYFINGLQTSATESFHNICNYYCPKGERWNFSIYCCRKNLAALHWNTKQREIQSVVEMKQNIIKKVMLKL